MPWETILKAEVEFLWKSPDFAQGQNDNPGNINVYHLEILMMINLGLIAEYFWGWFWLTEDSMQWLT